MTRDDWNQWLDAQRWDTVHRDQVRRQAERCIEHLADENANLRAEIETLRREERIRKQIVGPDASRVKQLILSHIEREFGVTPEALIGTRKTRAVTDGRHTFAWLCREILGESLSDIGRRLNRDHSTIINSVKCIENAIKLRTGLARRATRVRAQVEAMLKTEEVPA